MGWNPVKEAEKKAKQAIDKIIKPATNAAKDAIWKLRKETWARIEEKGKQAIKEIDEHVIEKIEREVEEIPDKIEEKLEEAFDEFAEAIAKEGLKKTKHIVDTVHQEMSDLRKNKPELVSEIDNLGGYIEIGPLTLNYSEFYTRTESVSRVLDTYINHPPEFRRKPILDMVKALGPTSVDAGISVQVMALVVGSKELGIGGGLGDIRLALFTEIGDVILEKMGVPE